MKRSSQVRLRFGFTLIELLVVIAIIAILMGLLMTAIPAAKDAARKLEARNMVNQVVVAANAYYTEYAKFPPLSDPNGSAPDPNTDQWVGDPAMGAQSPNNALFYTLRNIAKGPNVDNSANPRKVVYFEGKAATVSASGNARGGFFDKDANGGAAPATQDSCLFDPWGHQYGVILDTNGDDQIDLKDTYTDFAGAGDSGKAPRKKVGAFSMGKDEKLGTKGDKTYRSNGQVSDDVISWE
jgi:prepilin-type N-terminal cleavage/methylation domain-containing protein